MISFPLVISMGWTKTPPAFCAATEIITDFANDSLATNIKPLDIHHCFDAVSKIIPAASESPDILTVVGKLVILVGSLLL